MAIDWSVAYEAPISLDAARRLGPHERRRVVWLIPAGVVLFLATIGTGFVAFEPTARLLPNTLRTILPIVMVGAVIYSLFSMAMTMDWAGRRLEHWFKVIWRYVWLPKVMTDQSLKKNHAIYSVNEHRVVSDDWPGGVVEVGTVNLAMRDAATLAAFIQRLHAFYMGLRWPIQIVVRSTQREQIERRWFIAVTAPTDGLLNERLNEITKKLTRAGLHGRPLNGDLYSSLQECWSPYSGKLGPSSIKKNPTHAFVDGHEYVRGLVMNKWPRTIEPNWLAPIIDGDLCCDFSMWLDPVDNTVAKQTLASRITEWEAAQLLNLEKCGYRDPDIQESIKDATLTRLLIGQRKIRIFRGSVGFVVRGKTEAEMEEAERLLTDQLREVVGEDAALPLNFEQDKAPLLAVPTGHPSAVYPLQIVSPAAAMTYPFSNSSLRMAGGANVGLSIGSNRINTLNLFERPNPHVVIIGTSGAGKGYWVKVVIDRLIKLMGWPERFTVYVIQTEKDEYRPLARSSNGIVEMIMTYGGLEQLLQPGNDYRILKSGSPLVLFDLTKMPYVDRGRAIAWLLSAIERTAEWFEGSKRLVVLDELGIVMRDKDASTAINTAYRRFRSVPGKDNPSVISRIGVIGMTQLPTDFLGEEHPDGKVYIGLADTHLYLRQKPTELEVTKKPLDLTPDEVTFLQTAGNGDALLVAGQTRVALHLQATEAEHVIAKT
jgi:hypothetical protein